MSRSLRVVHPGYPHHVVQYGHNGQAVFRDDDDRRFYLRLLAQYSERHCCGIMAYCLMLNHVHLMLRPSSRDSLIQCLQAIGFRYAMYFNKTEVRRGALWCGRYFSSAITEDDYMWRTAHYICLNPVRVGIVKNPADYDWSSADTLLYGRRNGVQVEDWIDDAHRLEFRSLVLDSIEVRRISVALRSNKPYGRVECM